VKVISLERQVRIAAGAIVLTGALLARFVTPNFIWLSGFVGAGLVFAGITDFCGMGLLLAKLPWNKRKDETEIANVYRIFLDTYNRIQTGAKVVL
jgi:hypothetical protein